MNQPGFYAVIPAIVRYDSELNGHAKLLYGEITALCNKKGYCWATNQYFAELYGVSKRTITNWIKNLEDQKYIKTELNYKENSKEVANRFIWLLPFPTEGNFYTYRNNFHEGVEENFSTPHEKNFADNNTVINNTINNTSNKDILSSSDEHDCVLYKEVVEYLNEKAGTNYRSSSQKTRKLIRARANEGFKLEDFKMVIDKKVSSWINTDMAKYLRPETLFGTKFEGYLQEKAIRTGTKRKETLPDWVAEQERAEKEAERKRNEELERRKEQIKRERGIATD